MQDRGNNVTVEGREGNARMIPGAREARGLTRFAALRESAVPGGDSLMGAATIAERQREGGGSPKEGRRRPAG